MTLPDAPLAERRLAGYRVLRPLARDAEAEVLLGFAEPEPSGAASSPSSPSLPSTVVIKSLPATAAVWEATIRLLEALERARGDHVVQVLDLDADEEHLCLIFERLTRGTLAELLIRRSGLELGEVVTIVAPLAQTLARMHAAGVAHGAVGAGTVMFRDGGEPVLCGFGRAALFAPGSPEVVLEREQGVRADRRALRDLAVGLLARVHGDGAHAARQFAGELGSCPHDHLVEVLAERIFVVAPALPVRFGSDGDDRPTESARLVPLGEPVEPVWSDTAPRRRILLARLVPDTWAQRLLDAVDGSPITPVLSRAGAGWGAASPGRRRLLLGGGVVLAVVVGALAVVPAAPSTRAQAAAEPSRSVEPSASVSQQPDPAASGVTGNDPVAAAAALVAARDRCLRSLSVSCLARVEQPGSGALRDDGELIGAAQRGGELPEPLIGEGVEPAAELVERLGDSALVRLAGTASGPAEAGGRRGPASLLLVKSEAGWRIRDVIAGATLAG